MSFLSFVVLCVIAFFLWRISDQMPDVLFRLSEVQKDIAALRRQGEDD
jgi:sensor histidine kinase YesM